MQYRKVIISIGVFFLSIPIFLKSKKVFTTAKTLE